MRFAEYVSSDVYRVAELGMREKIKRASKQNARR